MNFLASPLVTDLYPLTMLHAYYAHRMGETAVFELFVRKLPRERNFLMAAGLEQALEFLEHLRFAPEELEWVEKSGKFPRGFAERLAQLRFTGDVHAAPEGTIFFPDEPVLRVTAPMPEAQLVESRLINLVHFETLVATKAARGVLAAPGKLLVDFGLRRAHGAEAGLLAARASYIAGYAGTATVAAGVRMAIPVFGTMAHSFVEAHDDEAAAFRHFAEACPQNVVLLIDTYDTEAAARKVVALAPILAGRGIHVKGVRLDSGDLAALSREVRAILDGHGLQAPKIVVSGDLDEWKIAALVGAGAPVDSFGVGAALSAVTDASSLGAVYKLVE
ncbi:MAG: nicotinate phosphoribosyltransferase, partial [Burkholderiales bacterium]